MSEPTQAPPPPDAARPVKASEVFAGIGIGIAVSWGLRVPLWGALVTTAKGPGFVVAVFVPTLALIGAMVWAHCKRRKGWLIGMAIYLGAGVLIFGPIFSVMALCARAGSGR